MTPAQLTAAKVLRTRGVPYKHIGREIGVPTMTVCRHLNPAVRRRNLEASRKRYATDSKYRARKQESQKAYLQSIEGRSKQSLASSKWHAIRDGYYPCVTDWQILAAAFDGRCCICGINESECGRRLAMDHCHQTGEFRGWLCEKCNVAIGALGDCPAVAAKAVEYLKQSRQQSEN